MVTRLKSVLVSGLIAAICGSAALAAEVKIAYVNTDKIIRDAPAAIKAGRKLEQEFSQRDSELKRLVSEIQSRKETLAKDAITLSESDLRSRERDINDLSREFQRRQQAFQEDLSLRQQEESSALIEKANGAIKRIAESESLDLVLQDAAWVGAGPDITNKVIQLLSGEN